MPTGPSGAPFLGGPIVLAIMCACFVSLPLKARLAYDLHMLDADVYGGAYIRSEVYQRAARRY